MSLTSGHYYAFLIALFFVYWALASRPAARVAVLVLASFAFYAPAGYVPVGLLCAVAVVDYAVSRRMARTTSRGVRRALLSISLAFDIGALCTFKYADFFAQTATDLFVALGFVAPGIHVRFVAPLAISFFIFQSVGYVVDVYRGGRPAERMIDYLAFVAFFPTIVAGPILRARDLLPKLRAPLALDSETGARALLLVVVGLTKKIVIADYLAANLVDRVFDFPARYSSIEVLTGVYAYALQIYADFSGYTDIAIGSALLLGFALPANFDAPYRSRSLPEFWRRWHISLSTWLRDYVFFPMSGGRRAGAMRLYAAVVVTMLLGGLWHGPNWTFVLWGLLHGLGLAAARAVEAARGRRPSQSRLGAAIATVATFHFVCATWIVFRAESVGDAVAVVRQLGALTTDVSNLPMPVLGILALGFAAHWMPESAFDRCAGAYARLPAFAQAVALLAVAAGLSYVASTDVVPFIYAQF